jgi:hypothetical protein
MKTKKIDREFLLSDSSVNVYGFRLLTKGYQVDEFKKNPIGYLMHDRKGGVIVKWDDVRIDGDFVYGKPVINMSHPLAERVVSEIENGFLNGASVGHIVVLTLSDDPKDMMPGQTGPTITRWYNREISLVDVPGNMNALALYDKEGNEIKLADFKIQNNNMKQIILSPEQMQKLNLKADSDAAAIDTAINDLAAKAARADDLVAQLNTANTEKQAAENKYQELAAATKNDKVTTILDQGLKDKKFTAEMKGVLEKQYAGKPDELKQLVDAMKPYESVVEKLNGGETTSDDPQVKGLLAKDGKELWRSGELDKLKRLNLSGYKVKYKEAFGEDYVEETN